MMFQNPIHEFLTRLYRFNIELKNHSKLKERPEKTTEKEISANLKILAGKLEELHSIFPAVSFELSANHDKGYRKYFYNEARLHLDSTYDLFPMQWNYEKSQDLLHQFLELSYSFNALANSLEYDSQVAEFTRKIVEKRKAIEESQKEEESTPRTQLSRKGMYLLFHFLGLFDQMDEKLSEELTYSKKAKLIKSFSPTISNDERKYVNPSAIGEKGKLLTVSSLNELIELGLELELKSLESWAREKMDELGKD